MTERPAIHYDHTYPYSYRAAQWLQHVRQAGREVDLAWQPFALKEVDRPLGEPSYFAPAAAGRVGIPAIELAQAANCSSTWARPAQAE